MYKIVSPFGEECVQKFNLQLEKEFFELWLWDYEKVYYSKINLKEAAASLGMDMSQEDFCQMLEELLTSPKAAYSLQEYSSSTLTFKASLKIGFANFSWTFGLKSIPGKEFVKEYLKSIAAASKTEPVNAKEPACLNAKNEKIYPPLNITEPINASTIIKTENNTEKTSEKGKETAELGKKENLDANNSQISSTSSHDSSSTLGILMDLKAAATDETNIKTETTSTPIAQIKSSTTAAVSNNTQSKEQQRRKELEEITAAKIKKPRRFI